MRQLFKRPDSLTSASFRYCPGCGHSIVHRLIAESIDTLGVRERVVGIAPVGCAVFAYDYFAFDVLEVAHGRPPAAATALKRVMPDRIVFSYQGDGDLAAIGTSEIVHAANRGENISVFFINNATYGMTGGQMAPTTLEGQRTTTTPAGRSCGTSGYPLRVAELLATIEGAAFIQRVSVDSVANVTAARKAIDRAFGCQIENRGFSLVEILSPCPTDWGMTPKASLEWMRSSMMKTYPLGVIVDRTGERG